MRALRQLAASAVVSIALVANSTAAVASAAPPPPPASANPWLALSMLTPSGSAALGDAAVAVSAAQPEAPPPPHYTGPSTPPLPVILIWLAVLGTDVYLLTKNNHTHPVPNSPA